MRRETSLLYPVHRCNIFTLTLLLSISLCHTQQPYPGLETRPVLNDQEAELFTKETYLQGWKPLPILTATADYTVGDYGYSTIQAAVNDAVIAGGTTRKYIKITEGIYEQIVYIPYTKVPITLYGAGKNSSLTRIRMHLSGTFTGANYTRLVGSLFKPGDPAYHLYSFCANSTIIGTICSSVVWVRAPDVEIVNLTIQNRSMRPGTDQAVALYTQEDKFHLSKCRLLSHQDTFWCGSATNLTTRGLVTDTYIEGDLDFVFGGGSTVFNRCNFHVKSDRTTTVAVVFAPATDGLHNYGYLVIDSTITGDASWLTSKGVRLARAWDVDVYSNGSNYITGVSPNGQLVVRNSVINAILPADAPYAASTSGREYRGNANVIRNLNNPEYGRFWEYNNTGAGAWTTKY